MNALKAIILIFLITATLAAATDPRLSLWVNNGRCDPYTLSVWETFEDPVPGADAGIAFDEGYIWERTNRIGEIDYHYKINLEGDIITSFPSPEVNDGLSIATGIAVDGEYLWINCNGTIYHVTVTGSIIPPEPFNVGGGIHDLAWDGEYLWVAYGEAFTMAYYKYDVNTGSIVDGISGLAGGMPETPNIAVDDEGYIYCEYSDRTSDGGGYYYIFEPNGDDIYYFYDQGFLTYGMDVGEWPATSIEPTSLGTIKALYK